MLPPSPCNGYPPNVVTSPQMAKVSVPIHPSTQECQVAAAVHGSAIFFPFMGPAIGLVLGGSSRYVRYHALNSLLGQVALIVLTLTIGLASISHTIWTAWQAYQAGGMQIDWVALLVKSVGVWLAIFLFGVINTVGEFLQIFSSLRGKDWGGRNPVAAAARRLALGNPKNLVSSRL